MTTQAESRVYASAEAHPAAARPAPGIIPALRRLQPVAVLAALSAALVAFGRYGTSVGLSELEAYKALRFVHITVALVALGSTFAIPILQPMAARSGVAGLRLAMRFTDQLENRLVTPGAILVIASGVGLILSDITGYRSDLPVWLIVGMAWVAIVFGVAAGIQAPARRRAIAILEETPDSGPPPAALMPIARRLEAIGMFLGFSTLAVLFLMAWRPEF